MRVAYMVEAIIDDREEAEKLLDKIEEQVKKTQSKTLHNNNDNHNPERIPKH